MGCEVVGCKVGRLPSTYLSLLLGARYKLVKVCKCVSLLAFLKLLCVLLVYLFFALWLSKKKKKK